MEMTLTSVKTRGGRAGQLMRPHTEVRGEENASRMRARIRRRGPNHMSARGIAEAFRRKREMLDLGWV